MRIYWIKTQSPRRVLALAKHLGLEAEFVQLTGQGLRSPEYAALNPNLKAPTLVDGDTVLWESSAIMAYLCIKAGSDMWPAQAPAEQVEVLRWLSWNNCHWNRAVGDFYFENVVKKMFNLGPSDTELLKTRVPELQKYATVLDGHLRDRDYAACGRLTIADFQLASMACYWREAAMPLQDFTHVMRWLERLDRIPAWSDPWPEEPRVQTA